MKKGIAILYAALMVVGASAQIVPNTNIYYTSGNVGIGTSTPGAPLDVVGATNVRGILTSSITDNNIGGTLILQNPAKTAAGAASSWKFYNMTGIYGNSLQFWAYDNIGCATGGTCNSRVTFMDNGNVGIGTQTPASLLDVNGVTTVRGSIISTVTDASVGGSISLKNPAKTAAGTASTWTIYNMSGSNGNSLQFWAYDNVGCGSGGLCSSIMTLMDNGNVGIGTTTPGTNKLAVEGTIAARKVVVTAANPWPDYVFGKGYPLLPLDSVAGYIQVNKHLPEMPSADSVQKNGLDIGGNQTLLVKKIEELTLYVIEQQKQLDALKDENKKMAAALAELKTGR